MIFKTSKNRRNRNSLDPSNVPQAVPATPTATLVATKVQIDTDVAIIVNGIPTGITVQGVAPTAVVQNSATRFTLTYAANVVVTNVCVIPAGVAQVKTTRGGFLISKSTTF